MLAMGGSVQQRADRWAEGLRANGRRIGGRVSWTPRQRLGARSLRGVTTLEEQTLPAMIVACLAALALIQVILTW